MAFDRSKIKATSVATIKEADKTLKKQLGKNNRTDKIDLEPGTNLLRIYPVHSKEDGGGDLFAEPVVMTYLPAFTQEKDKDGNLIFLDREKKNPKMKESVKPVFSAKVHGPVDAEGKCIIEKDLVEEYIRLAIGKANTLFGKDLKNKDREQFLEPIFGNFVKKINGINYTPKWIAYADLLNADTLAVKQFGDFEFKKSIHERITNIASIESAEDPMGTDPFTDPDDGRGIKILYNPDAEKATEYYTTEIDNTQVPIPGTKYKGTRTLPLTDAQLEAWSKLTPLAKRFKGSFGLKDLKLQIAGLEMFDKKTGYLIFNSDEFRAIMEAQSELFPEIDEESTEENNDDLPVTMGSATTDTDDNDNSSDDNTDDEFTLMTRPELIGYNKKERCGVSINATIDDEVIRTKLREWKAAIEASVDDDNNIPEETSNPVNDQGNGDINDIANGPRMDTTVEVATKPASKKKSLAEMKKEQGGSKKK